jgi:PAP2 superfamily
MSRLTPSDTTVLALLGLAAIVAGILIPGANLFWGQLGLLIGSALGIAVIVCHKRSPWTQLARPALTVAVIFTCYTTLGWLGVEAFSYRADAALSAADVWLFGFDPSLALETYLTPGRVEFFSFAYGAFIPYINITIALNCLGRPPLERDQFLTGWVFLYSISYLGYIFVPAHGPLVFHADDYQVALQGGLFYDFVLRGVEASGGLQGAFPSLHAGGSLYLCLFELRHNRLRGLIYLPLVVAIYAATLVLRYHYVVDLIAGTALALACLPLGRRAVNAWVQRRLAAGLPPLPGGEADALPALADAGARGSQAVLSAD